VLDIRGVKATVEASANERLFCIIDEGLTADIRMPARWNLVARDAFNGVALWKRKISEWTDHLHGFRSGPPEPADSRTDELALRDPHRAEAGFRGRQGAALCLVDATDGELLAQYELEAPPVFDGMIAARNRIFLSLENGSLVCFSK
jgi:hypothetical protein